MKIILVVPVSRSAMEKALNTSRLVKKEVTVNRAGRTFRQMRWVRPDEAPAQQQPKAPEDPEQVRGSKHGYGIHRINKGDTVSFKASGSPVSGKVIDDTHEEGVVVQTEAGKKYNVRWKDITGFQGAENGNGQKNTWPNETSENTEAAQATISPENFLASDWNANYDDPGVTADSILDTVEASHPGVREEIEKTEKRLKSLEQTIDHYRLEGEAAGAVYTPERMVKHAEIINEIFSPERVEAATPAEGEKPVFIMLGGRGGSGKSWFKGKVYDPARSIVLDADEIKGKLDEYEGWNAAQVHEESSDILEKAIAAARAAGLNVVLDATMKTTKSALKKVNYFQEAGYEIEAHYMYCPRQIAAKRAIERFMGKTKRYVPVDVVLANTSNEATFDEVRKSCKAWSFRSNAGETFGNPALVSESGKRRFSELLKSLIRSTISKALSSRRGRAVAQKERKDAARFDEYDNGPVTPDDKLAPDVKDLISRLKKNKKAGKPTEKK